MKGMNFLLFCFAVVGFAATGGCNSESSNLQESAPEIHEVDHEHNGHNHHGDEHADHEHDHGMLGPHGGHLIELGDDAYHAELVHEEDTDQLIVYLLDGQAAERASARVDKATLNLVIDGRPAQYELTAVPFKDETLDRCTRFVATDSQLVNCFRHDEQIQGRLNLVIAGKSYVGAIDHYAHGEQSSHDHHHDAHRGADGEPRRR